MDSLKRFRRSGGFSLIEMMFVIVIIGIITTIVANSMRDRMGANILNRTASQAEMIMSSMAAYYNDNHQKPSNLAQLVDTGYLTFADRKNNYLYNPWGYTYKLADQSPQLLAIEIPTPSAALANQLSSLLPSGTVQNKTSVLMTVPVGISQIVKRTDYSIFWPHSSYQSVVSTPAVGVASLDCPDGFKNRIFSKLNVAPNETDDNTDYDLIYWVKPLIKSVGNYKEHPFLPVVGYQTRTSQAAMHTYEIYIYYELDNAVRAAYGSSAKDTINYNYSAGMGHSSRKDLNSFGGDPKDKGNWNLNTRTFPLNAIAPVNAKGELAFGQNEVLLAPDTNYNRYTSRGANLKVNICPSASSPLARRYPACSSWPKDMQHGYIGELHIVQWCSKN